LLIYYRVILDEAQNIKNRNSNAAKGSYMLDSTYRLCMTGTPMMNNVTELFSLIHFCKIAPFCSWERFNSEIARPLNLTARFGQNNAMQKLQGLIKAVMLRRTKTSKLDGKPLISLPNREVADEKVQFESEEEEEFYRDIEQKAQVIIKNFMKKGVLGKKYTNALVLLLRLRQACCHRSLVLFSESANTMTQLDVPAETALEMAKQLTSEVVTRIKGEDGAFQCPICLDANENPAILLPCGHTVCSECFTQLRDANQQTMDEELNQNVKCPVCRGSVNPTKITDYASFKKVHMPELLPPELQNDQEGEAASEDDDSGSSDIDSDLEDSDATSETDDETESLDGFIVNDEVDEDDLSDRPPPQFYKQDGEKAATNEQKKKKKKSKGKKKIDHTKSLAELKKEGMRNKKAKKKYLDRLEHDYKDSAKIIRTMEMLEEIYSESSTEKVLIFSQFTTLLDILEIPLRRAHLPFLRYDGSMNARNRAAAVQLFRRDPNLRLMLVSLKAGNAGLNLNCASRVIILDPFWNPYIEDQAIDRGHRIGQRFDVIVRRVVVPGTVEDRILNLQAEKRDLINSALDENAARNLAKLGQRELAYLFGLDTLPRASAAGRAGNFTPPGLPGSAGSSAANALII
jgi:SNF2 family DNA or RNA helicase